MLHHWLTIKASQVNPENMLSASFIFITFRKSGLWAAIIPVLCYFGVQFLSSFAIGPDFYKNNDWLKVFSFIISSIITWLYGVHLNKDISEHKEKHSMYLIPLEYWAIVHLGIAGYLIYKYYFI